MTNWTLEQYNEYEMKRIGDEVRKEKAKQKASVKISEAQIKKAVADYLDIGMVQGKWWYSRLNSGTTILSYITKSGEQKKRAIKMCANGTADFVVVELGGEGQFSNFQIVTFFETKTKRGKQTEEQIEFQRLVESLGCNYFLIRSVDDVIYEMEGHVCQ